MSLAMTRGASDSTMALTGAHGLSILGFQLLMVAMDGVGGLMNLSDMAQT
ncbi:hypothetical protein N9L65_00605 [Candidatus Poseidoniales archaeon]|jgi:hypothetical protein|nr:hypothetical protein [Candidatus Poseidoniales archaeon]